MDPTRDISVLYRKMNMLTNLRLAHLGISGAKAIFLFCIRDHKAMSQVEICKELDMDKSTVAKMLMRMEKDGLIQKTVNPEDVRSVRVSLTDKAMELVGQAQKVMNQWVADATSDLTREEQEAFFVLLEQVANKAVRMAK